MNNMTKFKAYMNGQPYQVADLSWDYHQNIDRVRFAGEQYYHGLNDRDKIFLCQFINAKDSQGEDIYEGDIVTHPLCILGDHDPSTPCENFVGRIQYEADRGQYFAVNIKRNGYVLDISQSSKFTVIGNIHDALNQTEEMEKR